MKPKMTFTKKDMNGETMVKRTKSSALAEILEKDGWKKETSGGDKKGGDK